MVVYEVTVEVEPRLEKAFEAYMRDTHIPEILAAGCFRNIRFEKAGPTRFRTRYEAASRADLETYLDAHSERFRADFRAHFPAGCGVQREVWDEIQRFAQ